MSSHLLRRYLLLAAGLFIMAFGVAFSIRAGLGTSPISSLPYVLSLITPFTVGTATIALHVTLILLQILLLRRRYDPIQLMQLPVALVFGMLTDFSVWALQVSSPPPTPGGGCCASWASCWWGWGSASRSPRAWSPLAGEGMVLAVCKVFPIPFARAKVGFDVTLVVLASALSLMFLGYLAGVREGTLAAALCVGLTARQVSRPMRTFARAYLEQRSN